MDDDSREWISTLGSTLVVREDAIESLHAVLVAAAHFELARRRDEIGPVPSRVVHELAVQSADDALIEIQSRLDDFYGVSRCTTWASKFVLREARRKAALHARPQSERSRSRGSRGHEAARSST